LWEEDPEKRGIPAPFSVVIDEPPVDQLDDEYPIRLTTGRRLDDYNTGVQTEGFASPLRKKEALELSPEDGVKFGVVEGEVVKVSSRRGSIEAAVRFDSALRPGLAFMTLHNPDEVEVNQLTIEANDPKSGTAEFKASAIRIDKTGTGVAR
jgi:formate dehydrogenase major subunit